MINIDCASDHALYPGYNYFGKREKVFRGLPSFSNIKVRHVRNKCASSSLFCSFMGEEEGLIYIKMRDKFIFYCFNMQCHNVINIYSLFVIKFFSTNLATCLEILKASFVSICFFVA